MSPALNAPLLSMARSRAVPGMGQQLRVLSEQHSSVSAQNGEAQRGSQDSEQGESSPAVNTASTLAGGMIVGLGIGYLIDRSFDTFPGWTVGLGTTYIIIALYQVVKDALK